MENTISEQLRGFIARHVHSIGQLEILCLLVKDPAKTWNVDELFRVLQSNRHSIEENLRVLAAEGLLLSAPASSYRFSADNPEQARIVADLAAVYRERPVRIVELIYSPPAGPIQSFADAFKLRKDKP